MHGRGRGRRHTHPIAVAEGAWCQAGSTCTDKALKAHASVATAGDTGTMAGGHLATPSMVDIHSRTHPGAGVM